MEACLGKAAGSSSLSCCAWRAYPHVLLLLCCSVMLVLLLQATLDDPILSSQNFKQGSEAHRSKVRMWQGLSATVAFLGCGTQQEAATQACKGETRGQQLLASRGVCIPPLRLFCCLVDKP